MQTGDGTVYREYLYLKLCSDAICSMWMYQPCFSVAGFLPASRARLYKNMEKENTISMGEMLRCLVGLPYDGGPTLGTRGDGLFPAWLVVNLSVYSGRGWSVTPVFETEGVVSGR